MALTITEYISVSEADTYFAQRFDGMNWTMQSDITKLQALKTATMSINRQRFIGVPTVSNQTNMFPMKYTDSTGSIVTQVTVPGEVKEATLEEALNVIKTMNNNTRAELIASGVKSISTGNTSESYSDSQPVRGLLCYEARRLLKDYLKGTAPFSIKVFVNDTTSS